MHGSRGYSVDEVAFMVAVRDATIADAEQILGIYDYYDRCGYKFGCCSTSVDAPAAKTVTV